MDKGASVGGGGYVEPKFELQTNTKREKSQSNERTPLRPAAGG